MTDEAENGWVRLALQFIATCFAAGAALGLIVGGVIEWLYYR
jgi:hypothetical protein